MMDNHLITRTVAGACSARSPERPEEAGARRLPRGLGERDGHVGEEWHPQGTVFALLAPCAHLLANIT